MALIERVSPPPSCAHVWRVPSSARRRDRARRYLDRIMLGHDPGGEPAQRQPSSWKRVAGIVALYGLLGPLVGAFGVGGLFTLHVIGMEIANGDFDPIARLFWGGMVIGAIVSLIVVYAFGLVSAVGVGLIVAIRDRHKGGISQPPALVAAFAFWLLTALVAFAAVPPHGLWLWISALLVAHLLAAVVCTWIARRVFR